MHEEIEDIANSINPNEYIYLIENLTDNLASLMRMAKDIPKVLSYSSESYIIIVQTLTEFGICYTTNSEVGKYLSVR